MTKQDRQQGKEDSEEPEERKKRLIGKYPNKLKGKGNNLNLAGTKKMRTKATEAGLG